MAEEKTGHAVQVAEPEKDWEVTTERFVAFFDIMGFKDRVDKNSHEAIISDLRKIKGILSVFQDRIKIQNKKIKTSIFSDSIIIFSEDNSEHSLFSISNCSSTLVNYLLMHGIPIKGAISCGKISVDPENSIFFGKPIINAYLLLEELNFYGAILDESVEYYIKMNESENISFLFKYIYVKYKVPFKFGKATHYSLNWCIDLEEDLKRFKVNYTPSETLENLAFIMSGKPRIYLDNTLEFFDYCNKLEIKDEFNEILD